MKKTIILLATLFLVSCATVQKQNGAENATDLELQPASFAQLPGWQNDNAQAALIAFQKSCGVMEKRGTSASISPTAIGGTNADWLPICHASHNATDAKSFFESWFTPYRMTTSFGDEGLFTGYYESMLQGSLTKTAAYNVPLYRRPSDLVMVELGDFRPALKGQRIAGKVLDGKLKPYADRAAIDRGALAGQKLEIVWVNDADAAFFVQVQGSGRVLLTDGRVLHIGYDGQNGYPYTAIGRELIARGELTKDNVSLQTIDAWLKSHPSQAQELREKNPSYVFFKILDEGTKGPGGPVGAQGVALTPEHSLAVDPKYIPYGAPVFLSAAHPLGGQIQHLLIAQDTGGAIIGPVRGDVFWGTGPQAEQAAGIMKSRGKAWILLPKTLQGQRSVK
jgi:membrane-bound lytic murein transglycosylase A